MQRKKYNIMINDSFMNDLKNITSYIIYGLNNYNASVKLFDDVFALIDKISSNELLIKIRKYKNNYYYHYVRNFVIFYKVENDKIEFYHIIYGRRKWENKIK